MPASLDQNCLGEIQEDRVKEASASLIAERMRFFSGSGSSSGQGPMPGNALVSTTRTTHMAQVPPSPPPAPPVLDPAPPMAQQTANDTVVTRRDLVKMKPQRPASFAASSVRPLPTNSNVARDMLFPLRVQHGALPVLSPFRQTPQQQHRRI